MNKEFKFPPASPVTPSSVLAASASKSTSPPDVHPQGALNETQKPTAPITPSNIEVPAPPPMEKETSLSRVSLNDSVDDDVGDTVDIPLN